MKKILLLLTFIIACNSTIPCYAQSFFTDKNNFTSIIIIITAIISGIFLWYINIKTTRPETKFFSINNEIHTIIASGRGIFNFITSTSPGPSRLEITTDSKYALKNLEFTCKRGICTIRPKKNTVISPNISIQYDLFSKHPLIDSLKVLTISGFLAAQLKDVELLNKQSFDLNASNESIIEVGRLENIDSLNITCSDNSKIKIKKGFAKNATINLSNTAECIMDSFTINNAADVTTRDNSIALIQTNNLICCASNNSQIYYYGQTNIINQTILNEAIIKQI